MLEQRRGCAHLIVTDAKHDVGGRYALSEQTLPPRIYLTELEMMGRGVSHLPRPGVVWRNLRGGEWARASRAKGVRTFENGAV